MKFITAYFQYAYSFIGDIHTLISLANKCLPVNICRDEITGYFHSEGSKLRGLATIDGNRAYYIISAC